MRNELINKLLIIAGSGDYPRLVIEEARIAGVKYIEVLAFKGETCPKNLKGANNIHWLRVGQLNKMIDSIKQSGINDLMLVGQIAPKNLFSIRLDNSMKKILHQLPIINAHTVFTSIIDKIEQLGVKVLPAHTFISNNLPKEGVLSSRAPSVSEIEDIQHGVDFIKSNSNFDIGQTIAIKKGYVVAIEAMEGTNATIRRAGKIAGSGTIIAKFPKIGHDFRFDIPVVGPKTIHAMKKAKSTCLGIEAGSTIIFNYDKTISIANSHDISIIALEAFR